MALLVPQAAPALGIGPTFAAPTASDTIAPGNGLLLYVKNGATASTITVVVPGNQVYSGAATTDLIKTGLVSAEWVFWVPPGVADPTTGLITVTFSSITTVTVALLQAG